MKYSLQERKEAFEYLKGYRGHVLRYDINKVSRTGMSRRINFYAEDCKCLGKEIATILGLSYDYRYGMLVRGCGMDMTFKVLADLNYAMAQHDTGKTIQELFKTKECGERIYDNYFTDVNKRKSLQSTW